MIIHLRDTLPSKISQEMSSRTISPMRLRYISSQARSLGRVIVSNEISYETFHLKRDIHREREMYRLDQNRERFYLKRALEISQDKLSSRPKSRGISLDVMACIVYGTVISGSHGHGDNHFYHSIFIHIQSFIQNFVLNPLYVESFQYSLLLS